MTRLIPEHVFGQRRGAARLGVPFPAAFLVFGAKTENEVVNLKKEHFRQYLKKLGVTPFRQVTFRINRQLWPVLLKFYDRKFLIVNYVSVWSVTYNHNL